MANGDIVEFFLEHRAMCMGILAAVVSSAAYPVYIVEFVGGRTKSHPLTRWMWNRLGLRGDTHPRLVSWLVWMLLTLTIVLTNVRDGSPATAVLCGVYFCGNFALLVASLRSGTWELRWYDLVCFLLGAAALILLYREDSPRAATAIIITADIIAGIPTFAGVIANPAGESRVAWRIFFVGSVLNMFSFEHPFDPSTWGFVESAYTIYVVIATNYMTFMTTHWRPASR